MMDGMVCVCVCVYLEASHVQLLMGEVGGREKRDEGGEGGGGGGEEGGRGCVRERAR